MSVEAKWPKQLPSLSLEEEVINNDFMKYWHERLATQKLYRLIENFNHGYVIKHAPNTFLRTLEVGAGLGEHLNYEKLNNKQKQNYVALELRENMAREIQKANPEITTLVGDCQAKLPFSDGYFDRIIAIHVLEHLPNLPAAIKEIYRLCNKQRGIFSIVIPCEGALLYSLSRKISAQRIFEKRYQRSYRRFIEREHINLPLEIFEELKKLFFIEHKGFFPWILPIINLNLCIGLTLWPKY